jgi:hypothetical protein
MSEQREQRRHSRRTIAKGAAWAVPAVPLVLATPAYASSGGGPTGQVLRACKQPGASCQNQFGFVKGYTFLVSFTNPTAEDLYLYTDPDGPLAPFFDVTSSVDFTYASARLFTLNPPTIGGPVPEPLLLRAGQSVLLIINAGTNSNSANTDAAGTLVMAWGHTVTPGADPDHPYTPAPPNGPPYGEGWIEINFSFPSTPPCLNCLPGVTPL